MSPAQKGITLLVALELQQGIHVESIHLGKFIHLHRVVDHQFGRLEWIDQRGISTHFRHSITHGSQIDHGRDTGEILHEHARGRKSDFPGRNGIRLPLGKKTNVIRGHAAAIFGAQQVFKKNSQRVRKVLCIAHMLVNRIKPVNLVFPVTGTQFGTTIECIHLFACLLDSGTLLLVPFPAGSRTKFTAQLLIDQQEIERDNHARDDVGQSVGAASIDQIAHD